MRMRLLQIGIGSAILDLGANRPESGDIYTLMSNHLENLLRAFTRVPEPGRVPDPQALRRLDRVGSSLQLASHSPASTASLSATGASGRSYTRARSSLSPHMGIGYIVRPDSRPIVTGQSLEMSVSRAVRDRSAEPDFSSPMNGTL